MNRLRWVLLIGGALLAVVALIALYLAFRRWGLFGTALSPVAGAAAIVGTIASAAGVKEVKKSTSGRPRRLANGQSVHGRPEEDERRVKPRR